MIQSFHKLVVLLGAAILFLAACDRAIDIPQGGTGGNGEPPPPDPELLSWTVSGEYAGKGQRIKQVKFTGARNTTYNYTYRNNRIDKVQSSSSNDQFAYNDAGELASVTSMVPNVPNNFKYSYTNKLITAKSYAGKNAEGLTYTQNSSYQYDANGRITGLTENIIFANGGTQKTNLQVLSYNGKLPQEMTMQVTGLSFGTPINISKSRKFYFDNKGNVTSMEEKMGNNGPWIKRYDMTYDLTRNDTGFVQTFVLLPYLRGHFSPAEELPYRLTAVEPGEFYTSYPPLTDKSFYDFSCSGQSLTIPRPGKAYNYTYQYNSAGLPVSGTITEKDSSACANLNHALNWEIVYESF